jgi:1,2-diacylglycerol 3-beta-glucosyltransferase
MPATDRGSRSQRRRWEGGRRELVRREAPILLKAFLRRPSALIADLLADLVVPPLTTLALGVLVGTGCAAWAGGEAALCVWSASAAFLGIYVWRGWDLSGTGVRGLADLALAPAYVAWKLVLPLLRVAGSKGEWVRTPRSSEAGS